MSGVEDHGNCGPLMALFLDSGYLNSLQSRYAVSMSSTCACETLDALCNVLNVCCTTYRSEDAEGEGYWTLEAIDDEGEEYTVNSEDLLEAVCILAELLEIDLCDV